MERTEKIDTGKDEKDLGQELTDLRAEVSGLKQQVASLEAQTALPLEVIEIRTLRDMLVEQKEKLGNTEAILCGLALVDKMTAYLQPPLFPTEEGEDDTNEG